MKLKLDENLSRHLKAKLEAHGHDVMTVEDEGLLGEGDTVIGAAALSEDRMLFTLDVGFADIRRFQPGAHPGIVLFRPPTMGPLSVNAFVESLVLEANLDELAGCLVVVDRHRIRVRRP